MRLVGVLSSDAVTRSNIVFSAGALYGTLADRWESGVPSHISHDAHRLLGWTHPQGLSFQCGRTLLHGSTTIPDSDTEAQELEKRYHVVRDRETTRRAAQSLPTLTAALEACLDDTETPHHCEGTALISTGLARRVAPEVFETEDQDGLVPISSLRVLQPGVYQRGQIVLFAHQFLRRSLSRLNTLNAPFLEAVEAVPGARIRLDPDMVGLASTVKPQVEFEYWWGPKFPATFTDLQAGVCRHEASARQRFFYGISATDFWWQSRKGEWILEAEELRDRPTFGGSFGEFGCRYVHSIVKEGSDDVIHIDGAIRAYSEEKLLERLEATIATGGRNTDYTKLWRADGNVDPLTWKNLVHHYFRDNPLVGEYLGAEPEPPVVEAPTDVPLESSVLSRVPHSVLRSGGAKLVVSLHPLADDAGGHDRRVVPSEELDLCSSNTPAVSAETIELYKALRTNGYDLFIPDECAIYACEDMYTRLPLISHSSSGLIEPTIAAFSALVGEWVSSSTQKRRVVSLALEAPVESANLRLAIAGPVEAIAAALAHARKLFSMRTHAEVSSWATETADVMASGPNQCVDLQPFLAPSITFKFPRVSLDPDQVIPREDGSAALALPETDERLVQDVRSARLAAVPCWFLARTVCSVCAVEYRYCEHSKLRDGVTEKVESATLLRWFWSDAPA